MKTRFIILSLLMLMFALAMPMQAQESTTEVLPTATTATTTDTTGVDLPVVGVTDDGEPVYGIPTQPVAPAVPETTNTVIGVMGLIIVVLIIALLMLVFMVVRQRADSGDVQAKQWLAMLNATRDAVLPRDSAMARIEALEAGAATTGTPIDDLLAAAARAGIQIIYPSQAAPNTTVNVNPISTGGAGGGSEVRTDPKG
jgi:uncharacterized protein HemX